MSSVAAGAAKPIESAPATGAQAWTLLGCTLIAAFDGLDVLVMALAAPVLAEQWQLDARAIGLLLGTAPIGMAIGAAAIAPLADRIGRKRLLLLACALAGIGTLASSFTGAFGPLALTRLVTGLGIGAALPTLTTLTSEVAPERWRNLYIGIVTNGYSIGTIGGAMVAGAIIRSWGWQGLFWCGGVGPLLLMPLLWATLPESPQFLAARRGAPAAIGAGASRSTLGDVLGGDLRRAGLCTWLAFFCSFFVVYFIFQWIPSIVRGAGFSLDAAFRASLIASVAGLLGPFALAGLSARISLQHCILWFFVAGAVSTALVGVAGQSLPLILAAVFLSSFFTLGAEMGLFMFASRLYPARVRAGGVGWALGVGRFGAIFGPIVGGVLIGMGWGIPRYFPLFGAVLLVAAAAVYLSRFRGDSFAD